MFVFNTIASFGVVIFLSVIIDLLHDDQQIFVTTHNAEILDMDLPLHSFAFLRRDNYDQNAISCVYASDYIKRKKKAEKRFLSAQKQMFQLELMTGFEPVTSSLPKI